LREIANVDVSADLAATTVPILYVAGAGPARRRATPSEIAAKAGVGITSPRITEA